MSEKPIIQPYYSKYDTPKPQNRFQKAVFNGRATKVKELIASGENVYRSTDMDENPLFIAIVRDHLTIVNQVLDIYEEDLLFVRHFFQSKHNIDWKQRPVYVAHGADHVELVKELSLGMEVLPDRDHSLNEVSSLIILLKSPQEKKILWLRPNNREDNIRIAKIMQCIWDDGVIDLQHKGHWGRTVFDVAAIRNQPGTYCRLHALLSPEPEKSIEHFIQICRHQEDQLAFFKYLWNKTAQQVEIADITSTKVDLLVLPAYYDQIEIFQFFLESIADKTDTPENRKMAISEILNTYKVRDDSKLIESIIWADQKEFIKQCLLRFKPNLLLMGNCETILQSLIRQKSTEFMTQFVVEYFDQVRAKGMEEKIMKQLIEANWLDAIKILYSRYESCRSVLFRNKKAGVQCLLNAIDGCRYNLANYLVDAHRSDLTDPDDVTHLILYCSFVDRGKTVLQKLLTLPVADPLRLTGEESYYKSPIYVALKFHHLENYQLLMDNVRDLQGLRDIKEDDGENLLFAAVWFKENPVDETPFVYIEEEQASLEVIDSSDDEDESCRKRLRNEQILTSSGPYKDPIMPDSFFEKQSIEFSRIFNYLLNEVHLDYQCVNNLGETLLHVGVKRDNHDVVKQLLRLGLDLNAKDNAGNCPVHGVRSLAILNLLRDYKCDFNVANMAGETPLLSYAKEVVDNDDTNEQVQDMFVNELLKAGADINHSDVNGLTVLHIVKSVKIAKILLKHGAAINAKNKAGETPILYVFREQPEAKTLLKLFLCDVDLDISVVSGDNVSILSVLVSLDENAMTEVLASLSSRSKSQDLEDLFIQHCNSVDHSGCPMIVTACSEYTNSYCLDKLLNMNHLNPNVYPVYQPLEAATYSPHVIKRIIERGADVNGVGDTKRKTPLMHAMGGRNLAGYRSYFETVAVLLAAGADVEIIDENGDSALDYASRLENLKDARRTIAEMILRNADYYRRTGEDGKLSIINVDPFQCLFDVNTLF